MSYEYFAARRLRQQLSGIKDALGSIPMEPAIGEAIDGVD
jgi:hypothetical protein